MTSKEIFRTIFNKWSFIGIGLSAYSLWLYSQGHSLHPLDKFLYLQLTVVSILFWMGIGHLLSILPNVFSWIGTFVFSFLIVLLSISSYLFYFEYKEFLSTAVILLLKEQPVYFWSYFDQITTNVIYMGAIVGLAVVLTLIFKPRIQKEKRKKWTLLGIAVGLILICLVWLNNTFSFFSAPFYPMDIHNFYSIRQGFSNNPKDAKPLSHFVTSIDSSLAKDPEEKWNLVVVVFESFSREPLSFLGFDNNYTPFMKSWIKGDSSEFVLMDNSISVSGATDVSMPSIYTGVGPEEPYGKLITTPFLWDFAKAKGLKTYYATSQNQSWKDMESFVGDDFLDLFYHPKVLGLPLVNDIGADDLTVVDSLQKVFTKDKEPFFLFYNTNATHSPHQASSPYIKDFHGIDTRYGRALYITDRIVKGLVDMVKKRNEMDHTIFVFTADHGIYTVKRRSRLSSYFREALDVPMMFRFPKAWIDKHPEKFARLHKNKPKMVSNIDIAPTVFDILFPNSLDSAYHYSGTSLLDTFDDNRAIICLSTNDTRTWDTEGFGIYKKNESYIFHGDTGLHFYDLSKDPKQLNDILSQISPSKRAFYDSIVVHNQYMNRIYQEFK